MPDAVLYKKTDDIQNLTIYGYDISVVSLKANWSPHYHRAMEIIYMLEGKVGVFLGKQKHVLQPGDFVVVDSMKMHEVICKNRRSRGIVIEVSKSYMKKFIPDFELRTIACSSKLPGEHEQAIRNMGSCLHEMALLYAENSPSCRLRSSGLMMELLAILIEDFSRPVNDLFPDNYLAQMERLGRIIDYVEDNYKRPISLQEAADYLGLNREYFCRYFKKNLGYSFLDFLTNVRLNHIYKDLILTTDPVGDVVDRNGITNQKLFYRKFREKFAATPAQVRKAHDTADI